MIRVAQQELNLLRAFAPGLHDFPFGDRSKRLAHRYKLVEKKGPKDLAVQHFIGNISRAEVVAARPQGKHIGGAGPETERGIRRLLRMQSIVSRLAPTFTTLRMSDLLIVQIDPAFMPILVIVSSRTKTIAFPRADSGSRKLWRNRA